MAHTNSVLSINVDVIKKIAKMAAVEIEGVADVPNKNIDLKNAVRAKSPLDGVKVENVNDSLAITVYVTVEKNTDVKAVADAVQKNVKDKIQVMTNTAVTTVNVIVSDIKLTENIAKEPEESGKPEETPETPEEE